MLHIGGEAPPPGTALTVRTGLKLWASISPPCGVNSLFLSHVTMTITPPYLTAAAHFHAVRSSCCVANF